MSPSKLVTAWKDKHTMTRGVTVALQILILSVLVRIQAGQQQLQGGVVVAFWAHNPMVEGSIPSPVSIAPHKPGGCTYTGSLDTGPVLLCFNGAGFFLRFFCKTLHIVDPIA